MINKFKALKKSFKIAIIVFVASVLCFAITAYLLTTTSKDIPLGIIIAGSLISLLHFFQGVGEIKDEKNESSVITIIVIAVKFLSLVVLLLMAALMTYRWNAPYINIFSVVGVYTFSIIITILIYVLDKK